MQPVITLNRPKLIDSRPTVLTARAKSSIKKRDVRDTVSDWWNGLSDNAKMLTGVAVLFVIYLIFGGGRGYVSNAKSATCFIANDAGFLLTSGNAAECASQGNWNFDKFGTETQIFQGDQCISSYRIFDFIPILGRIPGRSLPLQTSKCDPTKKDKYQMWKTLPDRTESVAYPGYCLTSGFPVSTAVTVSACGNSGKIVMNQDGKLEKVVHVVVREPNGSSEPVVQAETKKQLSGLDVHSYTSEILATIKSFGPSRPWHGYCSRSDYDAAMKQAETKYATTCTEYGIGLKNIASYVKSGIDKDQVSACDPELPGINFIHFFIELVKLLDKTHDVGQISLFQDCITLIGATCVQGVSHRLWQLYNSLILDGK